MSTDPDGNPYIFSPEHVERVKKREELLSQISKFTNDELDVIEDQMRWRSERRKFEDFARNEGMRRFDTDGYGEYIVPEIRFGWKAWRASKKS